MTLHETKIILIVASLAGGVLVALLTAFLQLRRRGRTLGGQNFPQAYLHEPGLTWDEYGRRSRLTRSRLMFEEEVHRSTMIRKCQQESSRASDDKDAAAALEKEEEPSLQHSRPRSRTWHGEEKEAPAEVTTAVYGGSAEAARVDNRTWQQLLLHRSSGLAWNGERCPTAFHQSQTAFRPRSDQFIRPWISSDRTDRDIFG